ncbi:MAG TPA: ATP-binding protein [Fimbriimonas sp.]|nr:ATP-binding protein [Fimbriimonas sp.]
MSETIQKQLEESHWEKIIATLRDRLEEAEATLQAIRTGEVDALLVRGPNGDQVYTLKGADEPYRVYVEEMAEGAVTLDSIGTVLYCNLAFAQMAGEHLERVIGNNFSAYFPELLKSSEDPSVLAEIARTETVLVGQGKELPVLCSFKPVDLDGPAVFAVTITDLSQQKENESKLKKATVELEGFCYAVSHDMRAPLRAMMANARIVIEDYGSLLPKEAISDLEGISASASQLGKLMDDLLAYSRLVRQEVSVDVVDLSHMASQIAIVLSKADGVQVDWEVEPGLSARGDSRLLEMALYNLFSNAVKFSAKKESPKIRFGFNHTAGAFFVEDNGIGFDMQYASKLFEPFERLHRQADYEGTGIGLANVKRVINRHGGQVWADGEVGKRATFFFTLG